ncbi:hypothetical protein GC209_04675 [bacterium]|nr:hypothetical protein [bacterium]
MEQSDVLAALQMTIVVTGLAAGFAVLVFLLVTSYAALSGARVERIPFLCLVAFLFGTLALVTGMLTGASRTAAVGDVLPAGLGFIGAVALYVFTKPKRDLSVAAVAVVSFSILLFLGTVMGSYERARAVTFEESQKYDRDRLIYQANIEAVVNGYRKHRGLPPIDFSK